MNTSQVPPGGWVWHEPSTGWWAPSPIGFTFDQQIQNIIKHRKANMALTLKHKLPLDEATVGQQLIQYQQKRGALPSDTLPKLTPPPMSAQMSGGVQAAVAAVKKMSAGASLLFEWEQSKLPPEPQEVAESRAAVCVQCPANENKKLTDWFTVPVANQISKKFERLHNLKLVTSQHAKLFTCRACLCPLALKVFTPKELIIKKTSESQKQELTKENPKCWILQELPLPTLSSAKAESQTSTSPVLSEVGS